MTYGIIFLLIREIDEQVGDDAFDFAPAVCCYDSLLYQTFPIDIDVLWSLPHTAHDIGDVR